MAEYEYRRFAVAEADSAEARGWTFWSGWRWFQHTAWAWFRREVPDG